MVQKNLVDSEICMLRIHILRASSDGFIATFKKTSKHITHGGLGDSSMPVGGRGYNTKL
jgi:hypothetical protein